MICLRRFAFLWTDEGRLTPRPAEAKITLVNGWFRVTRIILVILAAAIPLIGQGDHESEPEPERPAPRYVSPPAWRSVEVGDFYLKRKSYRAALSRYKEAAKVDPYFPQAYLGMGKVYDRLGLQQKALENYKKYLDLLPSSKEAEEAREVHEAITRLEHRLKASKFPSRSQPLPGSSSASD